MKSDIQKAIGQFFRDRRCEFPQYGTYFLLGEEWVRFYIMYRDGIVVLRESRGVEYPEFIEYNDLDERLQRALAHYYIRRILKERFLM